MGEIINGRRETAAILKKIESFTIHNTGKQK